MTQENKIRNAARYWHDCQKEGFPKGQKEVFEEWLDKDIQNSIIYEKLFSDNHKEIPKQITIKKKTKKHSLSLSYILFVIFLIIFFIYIKLLY